MKVQITPDRRNYRKHGDKNKSLIKKSLEECGAGRSILVDKDGNIIAGNGVFEQAQQLGIPVKIIETDGGELIAVKRRDIATEDPKRKQLAVMDNTTSDSSEFDLDMLREDFDATGLGDFGVANFDLPGGDLDEFFDKDPAQGKTEKKPEVITCPHCGKDFVE